MVEEMILEKSEACEIVRRAEAKSEEEFREGRKAGLGGSDSGAIMELSKYKSPFMVACEKLGMVKKSGDTEATRRGKRREPWLRNILSDWYAEEGETGKRLEVYSAPGQYRAKDNPLLLANLDGFVIHPDLGLGVLEIKTAVEEMMPEWASDAIPDSYYAQGQHYCRVTGLPYTFFFAEVGETFLFRIAPRNPAFIADMEAREIDFWKRYIETRTLPEPMGISKEDDYLMQLYGESESEAILQLPDLEDRGARYVFLNEQIKALESEKKEIQNVLKAKIGEAKGAALGAYKATWSRYMQERFDTEAFKIAHPDLWQAFRKEAPSGRFTITAPKGGSK